MVPLHSIFKPLCGFLGNLSLFRGVTCCSWVKWRMINSVNLSLILGRNMFQLHGNPADYAWGAGGLDTIITQVKLLVVKLTSSLKEKNLKLLFFSNYCWSHFSIQPVMRVLLTQLLNQLESSGPPPAEPEKINGLPTVKISESQVGKGTKAFCF